MKCISTEIENLKYKELQVIPSNVHCLQTSLTQSSLFIALNIYKSQEILRY